MRLKTLLWLTIFSIAMGYLESSVVVYLREIFYPHGFSFPVQPITEKIALTELFREAATMVMLLGAGILAGKSTGERFAYFIYCFAVWDIFYYVFLKMILDWPESWLTWDLLFLIPAMWTGPVITPVIVSVTMILFALIILKFSTSSQVRINTTEWSLLISGSLILILAFIWDYSRFILKSYSFSRLWSLSGNKLLNELDLMYVPVSFNWFLFWLGELVILSAIALMYIRLNKSLQKKI